MKNCPNCQSILEKINYFISGTSTNYKCKNCNQFDIEIFPNNNQIWVLILKINKDTYKFIYNENVNLRMIFKFQNNYFEAIKHDFLFEKFNYETSLNNCKKIIKENFILKSFK